MILNVAILLRFEPPLFKPSAGSAYSYYLAYFNANIYEVILFIWNKTKPTNRSKCLWLLPDFWFFLCQKLSKYIWFFFIQEYYSRRTFLKTSIFKVLYFLKLCPIFLGPMHYVNSQSTSVFLKFIHFFW